MKSAATEVPPLTSEYVIITLLGGIRSPVGAVAMLNAAENFGSYPYSLSIGPMIYTIEEAAAVPDPEIEPNNIFARMFV